MVPDYAKAVITISGNPAPIISSFEDFLKDNDVTGKHTNTKEGLLFELEGISAHGMEPDKGKNAGLMLAKFLSSLELDKQAAAFVHFVSAYFYQDSRGRALGIAYSDDITGDLTINVGKLSYDLENGGRLGLNMRYPVTTNLEETIVKLEAKLTVEGFKIDNFSDSKPHHVDEQDFLVHTLKKVYEEQTGEKAELLAIGGGTYARSLKSGVAFGPLFPGRPDIAHQKDEYMIIEDLLKATAIYAHAIYELAK